MQSWKSLRLRVPLSLVVATLLTFLFVSIVIGIQTSVNLQADQRRALVAESFALSPILTDALLHDDVWTAYTALKGTASAWQGQQENAPFRLILDEQQRIFVSDHPQRFPLAEALTESRQGKALAQRLPTTDSGPVFFDFDNRQMIHTPLLSEDTAIGSLIIAGPRFAIQHRLVEILGGGLLVMLALLLVIIPFGWIWGSHLVQPLSRLAECMQQIGKKPIESLHCPIPTGGDEIGQLAEGFREMLSELREKQQLERQMVAQDRLAAIGRIAGGVAHEINNPLAGMLVAIDTYKNKPDDQKNAGKTLALVERGLDQIRETVSALLVECRLEQRQCSSDDIEDIHRLILADPLSSAVTIHWQNGVTTDIALPATAIRQILLNLVLNAVQSASESTEKTVHAAIQVVAGVLRMDIRNSGEPIPDEEMERIFEPFHTRRQGGTGFGLWITYQIVDQLKGEISLQSGQGETRFMVDLPIPERAAPTPAENDD